MAWEREAQARPCFLLDLINHQDETMIMKQINDRIDEKLMSGRSQMKKQRKWLLFTVGGIVTTIAGYTVYRFSKRPANTPEKFLKSEHFLERL